MPSGDVQRALTADPAAVGRLLLELPEDQWFERKSARIAARDLAETSIAFANAEGGTVVIGLSDARVEGTDRDPVRRNEHTQAVLDFTVPPVRARTRLVPCRRQDGGEDHLLVIDVEPGDLVHANQRDEVYLRVGDENRRLTFGQRQELFYDRGQATYESRGLDGAELSSLSDRLVGEYAITLGASDPGLLLQARGLATERGLTIAGCLLFADHPQRFLPEAYVRILRYRGRERGAGARQQLITDERVEGPIPHQLLRARELIAAEQPVRRALLATGRFGPIPLVPEDVWLEGLVNAVVHRSYSFAGDHVRVEIFQDRIEISSPGRFPGLVDLGDPLSIKRFARNPRIARVCADLRFGQELGEGIRRMFEEMRQEGLGDPVFRQTSASTILTLSTEPADRELQARLPDETRLITAALREGERLSTGELAQVLKVSRPVAIKRLRALQEAGLVEWVGNSANDPRAYWRLTPT